MATEEIEISELEFAEELASDNLIPVESTTDTKATSLQILKNWLSSFFVGKTGSENINGEKTFLNGIKIKMGNNDKLFLVDDRIDCSSDVGTDTFNSIIFRDSKGFTYANIAVQNMMDGGNRFRFLVGNKKSDGSQVQEQFWIKALKGGGFQTYAPNCENNGSILTTKEISKSNNYALLGNGLILQWGALTTSSTNEEVLLKKAFSTNKYFAVCIDTSTGFNYAVTDHLTTSFHIKASSANRSVRWFAIGF